VPEKLENTNVSTSMGASSWLLLSRALAGILILSFALMFLRAVSAKPGDPDLTESLLFFGLVGGGAMSMRLWIDNRRQARADVG
jgi:hypothetical protein